MPVMIEPPRIYQLEFRDHRHYREGRRNWTVRLGRKWYDRLKPGSLVWLCDPYVGEPSRLNARIERAILTTLSGVPDEILLGHHGGSISRNELVKRELRPCYNALNGNSEVTCIAYRVED